MKREGLGDLCAGAPGHGEVPLGGPVAQLSPQLKAAAVEELQGFWLRRVAFLRFPFGALHVGVAQAPPLYVLVR